MTLISVLKICFSLLLVFMMGCSTTVGGSKNTWRLPLKPNLKSCNIVSIRETNNVSDGYYLSVDNASNLVDNIDELKSYIKKLEILVNKISKYYGDKTEEQRQIEK